MVLQHVTVHSAVAAGRELLGKIGSLAGLSEQRKHGTVCGHFCWSVISMDIKRKINLLYNNMAATNAKAHIGITALSLLQSCSLLNEGSFGFLSM
jgi:hypothetical protein